MLPLAAGPSSAAAAAAPKRQVSRLGHQAACALLEACRTGSSQLEELLPAAGLQLNLPARSSGDGPGALHGSPERQSAQILCV